MSLLSILMCFDMQRARLTRVIGSNIRENDGIWYLTIQEKRKKRENASGDGLYATANSLKVQIPSILIIYVRCCLPTASTSVPPSHLSAFWGLPGSLLHKAQWKTRSVGKLMEQISSPSSSISDGQSWWMRLSSLSLVEHCSSTHDTCASIQSFTGLCPASHCSCASLLLAASSYPLPVLFKKIDQVNCWQKFCASLSSFAWNLKLKILLEILVSPPQGLPATCSNSSLCGDQLCSGLLTLALQADTTQPPWASCPLTLTFHPRGFPVDAKA